MQWQIQQGGEKVADDTGKADVLSACSSLFTERLNVTKGLTWSELAGEHECKGE